MPTIPDLTIDFPARPRGLDVLIPTRNAPRVAPCQPAQVAEPVLVPRPGEASVLREARTCQLDSSGSAERCLYAYFQGTAIFHLRASKLVPSERLRRLERDLADLEQAQAILADRREAALR